ncbi:hypothetical protein [Streptomyces sp. NPDC018947]|uniref:hypothetical protein n=1 Tax=Streptomyces sp. NPDC018947 TaxID=3365054 RepID=UPI003791A817
MTTNPAGPTALIQDRRRVAAQLVYGMPNQAIAEHTLNTDIGKAIGVRGDDVRTEINVVTAKAAALNPAHLVGLAHALGILGNTAPSGPRRQSALGSPTAGTA